MEKSFDVKCPNCSTPLTITNPVPNVRSHITPVDNIWAYRITSDEIKQFLIQKAKFFRKNIKLDMVVQYCENKSKKNTSFHKGHATFRIAFSNDVISKRQDSKWVDRIGESDSNIEFIEDILFGFIHKYQWDVRELNSILDDYKKLERLEDQYGITEQYIEYIRMFAKPARVKDTNGEPWIFFSVNPTKVISDMLEDPQGNKVNGFIEIYDVYPLTQNNVEFIVYVHENDRRSGAIDPLVRQQLFSVLKK